MNLVDGAPVPRLPDGFTLRGARQGDADAAFALVVAHHRASGANEPPAFDEVVTDLTYPDLDLDRDTFFVTAADGRPALYGIAFTEQPERTFFDLYIDPDLPRATALVIGTAIGARAIGVAATVAREANLGDAIVESGMVFGDLLLPEVFATLGLAPARMWWRMQADARTLRDTVESTPPGFSLVQVDPRDDDVLRSTLLLRNASFADHYGHAPMDWATYERVIRSPADFDPTALWFAVDEGSGQPVGFLLGDESRQSAGMGYVRTLGVLAEHRGRGLGAALLRRSFVEYARRGRSAVLLGVDTENATGAVGLYERVGMTVLDVLQTWERALAAPELGVD